MNIDNFNMDRFFKFGCKCSIVTIVGILIGEISLFIISIHAAELLSEILIKPIMLIAFLIQTLAGFFILLTLVIYGTMAIYDKYFIER